MKINNIFNPLILIEYVENICPSCNKKFECLGTEECWCYKIKISYITLDELKLSCSGCVCENCLLSKNSKKQNRANLDLL